MAVPGGLVLGSTDEFPLSPHATVFVAFLAQCAGQEVLIPHSATASAAVNC